MDPSATAPTQQKISPDQFAESIKAKYPTYASVDNATLTQKMIAKYPQYADKVDTSIVSGPKTVNGSVQGGRGFSLATLGKNIAAVPGQLLSAGKSLVNNLTGSEQGFGNEIAAGIGAPTATSNFSSTASQQSQNLQSAIQKIQQLKAQGIDTSSAEAHVKQMMSAPLGQGTDVSSVSPAVNDTPVQVALNAGGVAGDVLGAGTYGKVVKEAQAGKLFTSSPTVGAIASKFGLESNAPRSLDAVAPTATTLAKQGAQVVAHPISTAKDIIQPLAVKGKIPGVEGVGQQAMTSAQRLAEKSDMGGVGAAVVGRPIDEYNNFADQEAKHLADIKEDPAIATVGNKIGDAFKQVVQERQAAGQTMAEELKKSATRPVNGWPAAESFQKSLADSGANLSKTAGKGAEVIPTKTSKFSTSDIKILNSYANALDKLGKNPTLAQTDAFISRIPQEIEGLKASNNITFKTNAERIINGSLNDLRTQLGKAGTKEYNQARSTYSSLSKFIDEGKSHLGKITQSGDFAKDASLAKSAVQSVLNNGKKDWLIKLEKLTGYPALDQATLALQAMKDAGDFKGNSLLQLLTENTSKIPTTPHGVAGKVLGYLGRTVSGPVLGSPADRTRQFLQSLEK